MPKSKKSNPKTAATNETAAAVARHQADLDRLKASAETACENFDIAWCEIVATLIDIYLYIGVLRTAPDEMNAAARAAGVKLTDKRREKPSATFLRAICPEKKRQRIHEWATALEIAHKFGWDDAELCKALVETPLKKFRKTYDPAPQNVAAGKNARRDGALAVIKLDAARDFTGRVVCYGEADGSGRIKITEVAPSGASLDAGAGGGGNDDPDTPPPASAPVPPVPETSTDTTGKPPSGAAATPSTNNASTAFEALRRLLHEDDSITTLQAAADALNAADIATARGGVWYPASVRALIAKFGYVRIIDVPLRASDPDDDRNPPAAKAPVPTVLTTSTNAKGNGVKASPATVPPAANVDAAEIVIDAGDDGSAAGINDNPDPPRAPSAPAPTVSNDTTNNGHTAGYTNLALGPAPNMVVLESPATKDAIIAVLQVVSGIGLDSVGIEAADGEWKVWANDGIDKTVFMSGGCKIIELIDVKFIVSEIPGLLNALNASSEKVALEFEDIRVFKKIDPSDDNSETIEVLKRRLTKIKVGRYAHTVDVSGAPKAILKIDPKWTISTPIDLKCGGMSEFKKLISGVKNTHDRFTATNDGGWLAFNINYDYKHSASIPICPGEFSSGLSAHGWGVVQLKKLLKGIAALKVQTINLSIDAATGLLMIDLNKQLGQNEAAFFQVIIPGKIGT